MYIIVKLTYDNMIKHANVSGCIFGVDLYVQVCKKNRINFTGNQLC